MIKKFEKFNGGNTPNMDDVITVCDECGTEHGTPLPHDRQTWWKDNCDICGEFKEVTDKRHFNYLKKKDLDDDIDDIDDDEISRWKNIMDKEEFDNKFPKNK